MTGHPVLTLRAMRDRRAEDVMTGGLADFNRGRQLEEPIFVLVEEIGDGS